MSDLRVTIENGTTTEYATAAAAIRALLAELDPIELQDLKLTQVHEEQLRRMSWVKVRPSEAKKESQ